MTPDKGYRNNSVTISLLFEYPIHQRKRTKTCGSKHHYNGSDHSYTDRSHDEENIEKDKFMDELSNKDKYYVKDLEERKTTLKSLMGNVFPKYCHSVKIFTNIMSINEKLIKQKNMTQI